jgi:Zn-dependent M28 family amino/carboxypeptidase
MRTPTRPVAGSFFLGLLAVFSIGCAGPGCILWAPSHVEVSRIVEEVSADRLESDLQTLVGFGTRHTLSETGSDTHGIGAARRWIESEFRAIADASGRTGEDAIRVEMDRHWVEPDGRRITRRVEVVNPMLVIPGTMPEARGRMYYVVGHYDSRASDPNDATSAAPGADDDGSGTVLTMELARVFASRRFDATVVFMPVAGEEQGLFGSRLHAKMARERGWDIRGVLSNDIVGDPTAPDGSRHDDRIRLFSEGIPVGSTADEAMAIRRMGGENDSPSRELARYVAMVAAWHDLPVQPWLINRPDRFLRGGDHTGFNESGYAAVRFCEVEENYDRQHQGVRTENGRRYGDEIGFVDFEYLRGVAQVNGAALAHLANAPSVPGNARIIAAELTNDTTLRWDASPEPDVAGYEVMVRDTTEQQWRALRDVGDVREATVPLSKDNWFFGVRAYDGEGHRSPVAWPRAARE